MGLPCTCQKRREFRQKPTSTFPVLPRGGENAGVAPFVGRTEPLDRLLAAYRALTAEPNAIARGARLVLVTGEAGIGKTSLLRRFAVDATAAGGVVVWGSAWDGQAPAWWPWTQALRALIGRGGAPRDTPAELAAILPELGPAAPDGDAPDGTLDGSACSTPSTGCSRGQPDGPRLSLCSTTSTGLIRRPWTSPVS